ncbi:histidine kinase [Silvimonas sp.]|uniref:sensor histidine kinase n=1 Tax=Silvimonas sp. TaxID=2650811 RepID=UPI00284A63C1|nr:histidine kinase [Silvimonas sp.]MDR3429804.1 histidine kinase [Silvimonas sp.]
MNPNVSIESDLLPDFRNMGVLLRILVFVHLALFVYTLIGLERWQAWPQNLAAAVLWLEFSMLPALLLLGLANPLLAKLEYSRGVAATCVLVAVAGTFGHWLLMLGVPNWNALLANAVVVVASALTLLKYFHLRQRALSPRLSEARLAALQARIRPHFLFNSLNAVLALIRYEPAKAEQVLEDLADLFRVVMKDNRQLSRLDREVELAKRYLNIEMVRLGSRLKVQWNTENMPGDAAVPPLMLQPLVENAVYHGVEPALNPAPIEVHVFRFRDQLHLDVKNPLPPPDAVREHVGNGMALENIRERLLLHFDAEATLTTQAASDYYQVHIVVPYREITHDDAASPFFGG